MKTKLTPHLSRKVITCCIEAAKSGYDPGVLKTQDEYLVLSPLFVIVIWLKNEHGINVWIERGELPDDSWYGIVQRMVLEKDGSRNYQHTHSPKGFADYGLALCDGIERALKMLEPDKNIDHD
jgi:hypothetical protein